MISDNFALLLSYYAPQIPLYFIWLVGIVIALVRFKYNPPSMLLAIIAFAIFLLSSLIFTGLNASIIINRAANALDIAQVQGQIALVSIGQIVAGIAAWVLLFIALFRGNPTNRHVVD